MPRKDAGKIFGKKVVTTLSRYAAPVPSPISVNMFGLRLTSEAQKRWKNGQPPHSTTGVARKNSIRSRVSGARRRPIDSPSIDKSRTGGDSATLHQKRRRIESYSGSLSASAKTSMGSSAMPHLGQT